MTEPLQTYCFEYWLRFCFCWNELRSTDLPSPTTLLWWSSTSLAKNWWIPCPQREKCIIRTTVINVKGCGFQPWNNNALFYSSFLHKKTCFAKARACILIQIWRHMWIVMDVILSDWMVWEPKTCKSLRNSDLLVLPWGQRDQERFTRIPLVWSDHHLSGEFHWSGSLWCWPWMAQWGSLLPN